MFFFMFFSFLFCFFFFFSSRRRHTRFSRDWSSDVCSSDLTYRASNPSRTPRNGSPIGTMPDWRIYSRDGVTFAVSRIRLRACNAPGCRRSEERRVGKECRWRGAAYELEKKDDDELRTESYS